MCRSIKTLRGADPPATGDDVHAAALQFVRKLSGYRAPSAANRETFDAAVDEVATAAARLLDGLATTAAQRSSSRASRRAASTTPKVPIASR
jgi:hypothetical protein